MTTASERKIDGIVRDISDIKRMLQSPAQHPRPPSTNVVAGKHEGYPFSPESSFSTVCYTRTVEISKGEIKLDRSWTTAWIVDFVNCVADFPDPQSSTSDTKAIVASLRNIVQGLGHLKQEKARPALTMTSWDHSYLPPQQTAVSILRWARSE